MEKAMAKGYTQQVMLTLGDDYFEALVKPSTDFDSTFRCYDVDNSQWLLVNGWMLSEVEPC